MKKVVFEEGALEDFSNWANVNIKIYNRIIHLIKDILRTPYKGIGKPEPLKHKRVGYWSRRINHEHRIVYKVVEDKDIMIVSCKGHYD
jgi:toxin YoeB